MFWKIWICIDQNIYLQQFFVYQESSTFCTDFVMHSPVETGEKVCYT